MVLGAPIVKDADMAKTMQEEAIEVVSRSVTKHTVDKDIASELKAYFNQHYGRSWHCIVGKQYGSDVSHEAGCFIYFFLGDRAILLFKSG